MKADTSALDNACKRLRRLGFTKSETLPLINQVRDWAKHSGEEWTVNRLKSLKTWFVNLRSGNAKGNKPKWVATHGDLTPKGPFRRLFLGTDLTDRKEHRRTQRSLNALMIYTTYVSPKLTLGQAKKFVNAVEKPWSVDRTDQNVDQVLEKIYTEMRTIARRVAGHYRKLKLDHPSDWMERLKSAPMPPFYGSRAEEHLYFSEGGKVKRRPSQDIAMAGVLHEHVQELLFEWLNNRYEAFLSKPKQESAMGVRRRPTRLSEKNKRYDSVLPFGMYLRNSKSTYVGRVRDWVGNIAFLQETGYKCRTIANVHPLLQAATSQLAKSLWRTLEHDVPEDAAFNQAAGISKCQTWLRHGEQLCSVDLSSATDNFPWTIQERFLDMVSASFHPNEVELKRCWDSDAQLVRAVARGGYWTSKPEDQRVLNDARKSVGIKTRSNSVRWRNGQPLGAFFSFPLFSLCHHAMVRAVKPDFYQILGDDLVLDSESGKNHMDNLAKLKIPISPEKTISGEVGEFGGKLFHATAAFTQLKYRRLSDLNFVEQARMLGPRSVCLFQPRQRKVLKILDVLLPSICPQALGWNTPGLTYQDRVVISERWALEQQERDNFKVAIRSSELRQLARLRHSYSRKREVSTFFEQLERPNRVFEIPGTNLPLIEGQGYAPAPIKSDTANTLLESLEGLIRRLRRKSARPVGAVESSPLDYLESFSIPHKMDNRSPGRCSTKGCFYLPDKVPGAKLTASHGMSHGR